ncbi:hypothetical protein [Idiomarina xiamenensis]|uniref:Uncharacterized protein n=1 Tax=Idiomarina xiamenensis 10-D-4 TaxID=740709 RepID=K2K8X8_9GAMM|nr:hypothetical protein [Idiomarina xiamenensis]EKE79464.1 hypothetical protein A10D4_12889 [Idiomarina xiamenensis 10-D-4]
MAKPRRKPDQVIKDQAIVAEMYLKGRTMADIADELGASINMVNYDLREVRKRWRNSAVRDFDAHRAEQLARLDLIEAAAWREWERSCEDYYKHTVGETAQGEIDKEETGGQTGDPRYMNVILSTVERRCKLLGLDAPTKVAPTNPEGDKPYQAMSEPELDQRIAELLQKLDK